MKPPDPVNSRLLLCPGELRPDLLRLFGTPNEGLDCLVAAPGALRPFEGQSEQAEHPCKTLTSRRAFSHRDAVLSDFDRGIDRLPRTQEWESNIGDWIQALGTGGVQIRHAGRQPVHTRLISRSDGTVLPHAPLTLGSVTGQAELQVELSGSQHLRARQWFSDHFNRSDDMSDTVREHLLESWAGGWSSPSEVYFKVLSEYFEGVVTGLDFETDDNPMLENLTDFQRDAYLYAKTILQRYGGTILADVVGLGKTYIALALLAHLQRRYGEHAVVVAPPAVLPTWKSLAREFRIELAVVSLGKLDDLEKYADREVLVVDESHHFRNAGTNRYATIHEWLRPDGDASWRKTILLSATPQNNSAMDVKSQLQLFPDNFARLPYRGESLDAWFSQVTAGTASLVDMLQHVVVRRTRNYIRSAHPDATLRTRTAEGGYEDKPLHFPERISGEEQTLRYSLDATYGGAFYGQLLDAIGTMKYPLHGLGEYVRPDAASDPVLRRLRRTRGASLRGLFKVLLLKRLESSVVALHTTLCRFGEKLALARDALARNVVVVGHRQLDEDDADDALVLAEKGESEISSALFELTDLRSDIEADLATVTKLLEGTAALLEAGDTKVSRLRDYLSSRSPTQHRTLIFTQFADTASHLHAELGTSFGRTEVVTGSTGSVLGTARRFAPKANRVPVPPEDQIDLLISTDVLSEGVNLQDADTLINYDLHWNPVRLIQRAGRIDRIGSEHDEIHVSSFLPARTLEASLGLEAVLRKRIEEFVAVFGEDSHVLPSQEKLDPTSVLSTYTGAALKGAGGSDELDGLSRHVERLLALRREEPELYARVLDLRLGRRAVGGSQPSIIAMRRAWYWTFWSPEGNDVRQLDALRGFDSLYHHVEEAENLVTQVDGSLLLMEQVTEAFRPLSEEFVQQRRSPRLSAAEAFVFDQVTRYRSSAPPALVTLVDDVRVWIRQGQAQSAIGRLGRRWKKQKLSPRAVFEETRIIHAQYPSREEEIGEAQMVAAMLTAK